jgi:hypothetical protein
MLIRNIKMIGLGGMVLMACGFLAHTNTVNALVVGPVVRVRRHDALKSTTTVTLKGSNDDGDNPSSASGPLPEYELPEEKAERLRRQAEEMRKQIERLEDSLQESRQRQPPRERFVPSPSSSMRRNEPMDDDDDDGLGPPTLRNKRILVAGANGRLGSMICRYLLRNHPEIKEVVALVHYIGESSTRGYGRLSYEVVSAVSVVLPTVSFFFRPLNQLLFLSLPGS